MLPMPTRGMVVVIDDEEAIRFAVRLALEDARYTIAEAADGRAGLEQLRRALGPVVVLLDLMLPVMSGVQLIHLAATEPRLARHRYIVVTAARAFPAEDLARYLPPGHLTAVAKPFDLGQLVATVERAARQLAGASASAAS